MGTVLTSTEPLASIVVSYFLKKRWRASTGRRRSSIRSAERGLLPFLVLPQLSPRNTASGAIWPPVQCGHPCNAATRAMRPPVQYGHPQVSDEFLATFERLDGSRLARGDSARLVCYCYPLLATFFLVFFFATASKRSPRPNDRVERAKAPRMSAITNMHRQHSRQRPSLLVSNGQHYLDNRPPDIGMTPTLLIANAAYSQRCL